MNDDIQACPEQPLAMLGWLPPIWPDEHMRARIRAKVLAAGAAIVVADDDPTGTQTVHDVPVLTTWGVPELTAELACGAPVLYVLTNSRALPEAAAVALALELGGNVAAASRGSGRPVSLISRGDSTLRGHFPAETDALTDATGREPDGVLLVPYFREGGRFTVGDVHYVQNGQRLVPAAQTEYARDVAFGYRCSRLPEWVEEKSGGRWPASRVLSLSIGCIRAGGPVAVARHLCQAHAGQPIVVNAVEDRDLEVVVEGLLLAESQGKRFLARSAASFVKVRAGISDRGQLTLDEVPGGAPRSGGGLVVVGSYMPRTTRQLGALLQRPGWQPLELRVPSLLDRDARPAHLAEAASCLGKALAARANVALFTSREPAIGSGSSESLAIGRAVSSALVELLLGLETRPRFIIAKGGVTSSDLATAGLGVRRALVLGQIAPGVPVWRLGDESRWPGLAYVVFPGNVGGDDTLSDVAAVLTSDDGSRA